MLVPLEEVNLQEIYKRMTNKSELDEYVQSLIPQRYRHNFNLLANQKYYISYLVYKDNTLAIEQKRKLAEVLIKGVRTVGILGEFVFLKDLERCIDFKKVNKLIEENKK